MEPTDTDALLAMIREQARVEASVAHTPRHSPAWRVQQAMRAVAEILSGHDGAQYVSDTALRHYVQAYLDAYDAAAKAQQASQVNGGETA